MTGHALITDPAKLRPFRFPGTGIQGHGEKYVYIVGFDSGLIKVGHSTNPQGRVNDHVSLAANHGAKPAAVWVSMPHEIAEVNEGALITYCRKRAAQRMAHEYFLGVAFDDVVGYASTLDYHTRDRFLAKLAAESAASPSNPTTVERVMRLQQQDANRRPAQDIRDALKLADRVRDGDVRVMTREEFNALMDKLDQAKETLRTLKSLLGMSRIAPRRLPAALRAAADLLDSAGPSNRFYLDCDWDRLHAEAIAAFTPKDPQRST